MSGIAAEVGTVEAYGEGFVVFIRGKRPPLMLGQKIVIHLADQDLAQNEDDEQVRAAMKAAYELRGVPGYPKLWTYWQGPCARWYAGWDDGPVEYGDSQPEAAEALVAQLQAQQQKPVEEMGEAERAAEIHERLHVYPTLVYWADGTCAAYTRTDGTLLGSGSSASHALGTAVCKLREEAD